MEVGRGGNECMATPDSRVGLYGSSHIAPKCLWRSKDGRNHFFPPSTLNSSACPVDSVPKLCPPSPLCVQSSPLPPYSCSYTSSGLLQQSQTQHLCFCACLLTIHSPCGGHRNFNFIWPCLGLLGSQFPDQGLDAGHSSESLES